MREQTHVVERARARGEGTRHSPTAFPPRKHSPRADGQLTRILCGACANIDSEPPVFPSFPRKSSSCCFVATCFFVHGFSSPAQGPRTQYPRRFSPLCICRSNSDLFRFMGTAIQKHGSICVVGLPGFLSSMLTVICYFTPQDFFGVLI